MADNKLTRRELMRASAASAAFAAATGAVVRPALAARKRRPKKQGQATQFSDWAVTEAIEKARKYLWSLQKGDGSWPDQNNVAKKHPTGLTALATYALLAEGENPQEPKMAKALKWLSEHESKMVYPLGLRCYAWYLANRTTLGKYRKELKKDATLLYSSHKNGHYHYHATGKPENSWDNSCSQYGLLGVWAAAADGTIDIPYQYWQVVMKHWIDTQGPDGGWKYSGRPALGGGTRAMGTAGVASLFVCYDYSGMADKSPGLDFPPIKNGLEWMEKNYLTAPMGHSDEYYYLYGVERVGLASGYKFFGKSDWYKMGASKLLKSQGKNGGWVGRWGSVEGTAFAMLFLIRGQHPVLFNKLEHGGDWDRRSRDMAAVTRWISNNFETTVNWQVIDLKRTNVADWHDASVLYITGTRDPKFTEAQLKKIRTFVLQGGTIFTVVQKAGEKFNQAMEVAYKEMFPEYEIKAIPKDHDIYSVYFPIDKKLRFRMLGNGVRPFVIHTDDDLAAKWQASRAMDSSNKQFQVALNVAMYAVDKVSSLPYRGAVHWPARPQKAPSRKISVVRLKHSGNWNPEPLAYQRFANMMALHADTALEVGKPIEIARLTASPSKIAIMTGVGACTFSDADRAAIKKFVEDGGTLVIDAAGGSKAFGKSVESMLKEIYPAQAKRLPRLATTSTLYNLPGMEIQSVGFKRRTGINRIDRFPELRTVIVGDDRPGVIYSPLDLTAGLVGARSYAIDGYVPYSAFELMRNIVFFASGEKAPASGRVRSVKPPPTGGGPDDEW